MHSKYSLCESSLLFLDLWGVIKPCYTDEEGGKKGIPEQLNELET